MDTISLQVDIMSNSLPDTVSDVFTGPAVDVDVSDPSVSSSDFSPSCLRRSRSRP